MASSPAADRQFTLFVYMTAIYLLLNTGYSLFSVPYLTMASEMSDDPDERTTLLSFRNGCLAIGLVVGGALAPKIVACTNRPVVVFVVANIAQYISAGFGGPQKRAVAPATSTRSSLSSGLNT